MFPDDIITPIPPLNCTCRLVNLQLAAYVFLNKDHFVKTYWNIDRIMRLIIGLAIATALVFLIRYLSDVLLPFFVALAIAYLLQPFVEFNRRWMHTRGRALATIVTILDVTALLVLMAYLFLPAAVKEIDTLGSIVKNVTDGRQPVPPYMQTFFAYIDRYINPRQIKEMLGDMHLETLLNKGSSLLAESIDVVGQVIAWALTLIYVLFILIDYPQIANGFKLIFPRKVRPQALQVVEEVKHNLNRYFRGQGLVAICAAVLYCIGFSLVGLPLAVPMGLLVGILYMIPYFQYVTLIPVAIIAFIYSLGGNAEFFPLMGRCVMVYVVSQSVCDYIITPHIMGKELGMNPAIILLSLSVWGSLLGIIGMIIALPVSALLMTYYERYISEPGGTPPAASDIADASVAESGGNASENDARTTDRESNT